MFYFKNTQNYLFFFIILLLYGCTGQKRADVSQIDLDVQIARFDLSLDSLTPENAAAKNRFWQKEYGHFYADYLLYMLKAGEPADSNTVSANLREIAATPDFSALKKSVKKTFPDLAVYETGLTETFKQVKFYFPQVTVPRFISFFSGFSIQVPIGEGYIGIGLDMFLGADAEFYPALRESIPLYLSRRFTPDHLVPRVTETFLREELYAEQDADRTLLEKMLYNGKILYLLDILLPSGTDDALKIGYSKEQLAWAKGYEKAVWAWFMEENLVYESDFKRIQRYLGEAPFTPAFGKESAPRLGLFVGWQIIRKYMQKHPDITLQMLLDEHDAQRILTDSGY